MKIFYCCYGSAHSSVVAAAIHLGMLPSDRLPDAEEFERLPRYDKTSSCEIGYPFFMGKDEKENEVFIIGMTSQRELVKRAIASFLEHSGVNTENLLFIDTLPFVNLKTKIGGILSRRLGLVSLGRPLTIEGIREKYFDFVKLVQDVKKRADTKTKT
ncbi:DUF3189 family protein [Thermosediminibacter oceani]|uniref:DUF3189 domain-containing protein n=1 Tax=Thermosediminibacter oceani (strain ATCC BAA-1034 / DSM 16646 / JW/IW-1228P) TaxID=555079 RepID=D9S2W1_THEOJ|nr:DUF3189 family protein [Thermosediminibacter oceani]ADL07738.1 conserved hypothetical protein [Thermosediminibacter oceani DSM 16646]